MRARPRRRAADSALVRSSSSSDAHATTSVASTHKSARCRRLASIQGRSKRQKRLLEDRQCPQRRSSAWRDRWTGARPRPAPAPRARPPACPPAAAGTVPQPSPGHLHLGLLSAATAPCAERRFRVRGVARARSRRSPRRANTPAALQQQVGEEHELVAMMDRSAPAGRRARRTRTRTAGSSHDAPRCSRRHHNRRPGQIAETPLTRLPASVTAMTQPRTPRALAATAVTAALLCASRRGPHGPRSQLPPLARRPGLHRLGAVTQQPAPSRGP